MTTLTEEWIDAVRVLGGDPDRAWHAGHQLAAAYSAPDRHYHGTDHVRSVLDDVAALGSDLQLRERDAALVRAAACAHDVVYDGRPGQDEAASADWAVRALTAAGVDELDAGRVGALVLATADHRADPQDLLAQVLLDADLAVLGSPVEVYDRYVLDVRADYADVSDEQWRTGRSAVLRELLGRERLYSTAAGHRRWAEASRANLRRELSALSG